MNQSLAVPEDSYSAKVGKNTRPVKLAATKETVHGGADPLVRGRRPRRPAAMAPNSAPREKPAADQEVRPTRAPAI